MGVNGKIEFLFFLSAVISNLPSFESLFLSFMGAIFQA